MHLSGNQGSIVHGLQDLENDVGLPIESALPEPVCNEELGLANRQPADRNNADERKLRISFLIQANGRGVIGYKEDAHADQVSGSQVEVLTWIKDGIGYGIRGGDAGCG